MPSRRKQLFLLVCWLTILLLIGLAAASCGSNPVGPTTSPSPSPTASASPTPTPPLRPLEAGDFNVSLKAATSCCADADESNGDEGLLTGWPFVNEATLDLYSRTGVRITEIRLGPNNGASGDPGPEESLRRAQDTAAAAQQRGIYLIVGLYDAWPLKHGLNAYGDTCEVMKHAPRDYHLRWVHDVVGALRGFDNVTFYDGNETYDCDAKRVWVNGLFDAARSAGYGGLLGSNAGLGAGDFEIIHGWRPASAPGANMESDNRPHEVEDWLAMRAGASGTTFYWRGPMRMSEWVRLLEHP